MNKNLTNLFFGMLAIGGAFITASCASEDVTLPATVDESIQNNGLTVDLISDTYAVPVKADGKWEASIPEDCLWAEVVNPSGEGNSTLYLYVDPNTEGIVRSVPVTITSEGGSTTFNLTQDITLNGEPASNDDPLHYHMMAKSKGLGQGYDLVNPYKAGSATTLNLAGTSVINVQNLVDYFNDRNYYSDGSLNTGTFYGMNDAMFESKKDSLGVSLSVKISYGAFKFDLKGEYHGYEDRITDSWHLQYSKDFPNFNASVDFASVTSDYWDHEFNGDPDENVVDFKKGVLNSGFVTRVKKIMQATTEKARTTAMKNLIDNYGTGVVVGATFGGNVALDCYVDTVHVSETLNIKGAIEASFKAALFSIDAGVEAEYLKTATSSLNNSVYEFSIRGGSQATSTALEDAMRKVSFEERDVESINNALKAWANSITYSNDTRENTCEILTADIRPIWLFVPDELQDELREYVLQRYPSAEAFNSYRD